MRPKIIPNNNEKELDKNDFIVSKTDTRGIITYCNQIFMEMAEYEEKELIGVNHNIIRHPDVPKIAFKVLWQMIQSGQEFFGFVKNLRKSGGYYWVFANIMPDYDLNGKIIGYTSVRRKPNPEALKTIIPLYQQLVSLEKTGGMNASLGAVTALLEEKNMEFNELALALQGDM